MDPRKTLLTDVSSADILLAVMEPGEGGRESLELAHHIFHLNHGDEIRLKEFTWKCGMVCESFHFSSQ